MDSWNVKSLDELNGFQIAALALVSSALVAAAVTLGVRRTFLKRRQSATGSSGPEVVLAAAQPAVDPEMPARLRRHFSENLIVPGITQTGLEIAGEDAHDGRSREGV